jgi:hypothetical protein
MNRSILRIKDEFLRAPRLKYERCETKAPGMKLSRVRFTVRRIMVAVVVVGVLLWTTLWLGKRVQAYFYMADYHSARMWTAPFGGAAGAASRGLDSRGELTSAERDRWHTALAAKYLRAARYPWLSVEPDPPESD